MALSCAPPPDGDVPKAKVGCAGEALSPDPPPPICHRVTIEIAAGHSTLFAFAARPVISTISPAWLGISKFAGLLAASAPKCQAASATTKKLVASGGTTHAGATVSVVVVFAAIVCSCPAPVPRVILAVSPR